MLHGAVVVILVPFVAITSYWLAKSVAQAIFSGIALVRHKPKYHDDPYIFMCGDAAWKLSLLISTYVLLVHGWINLSWWFAAGVVLMLIITVVVMIAILAWVLGEEEYRYRLYDDEGINVGGL